MNDNMQASFSILVMSIASSAAMSMGLSPNPQTNKIEKDKNMAKFNIDLLLILQEKTKKNLTDDECKFLDSVVADLQMKYIDFK